MIYMSNLTQINKSLDPNQATTSGVGGSIPELETINNSNITDWEFQAELNSK